MDVTCTRCGTDYEFEETLISTRGTTVKCTKCGHLFKVFRPEEEADDAGELPRTNWSVRHADGSTEKLASLAELTRRITEGQLSEDDQISRSGQAWKRLGEIDELRGFFVQGRSGRPPAPRGRSATPALGLNPGLPIGVGSSRPPRPASSDPPPTPSARPAPPTPSGRPAPPTPSARSTSAAPSARPAPPTPSGRPAPPTPGARSTSAAPSARPAAPPQRFESMGASVSLDSSPPQTPSPGARAAAETPREPPPTPKPADADADADAKTGSLQPLASEPGRADTDELAPARRSRGALWLMLAILIAGGGASAWLTLQPPSAAKPAQDSVTLQLDEADAALASHRRARFNDGVVAYGKALAAYPIDPHVLSSVSRTYAVWAQEVQFELDDLAQRETGVPLEHRDRLRSELHRLTGLAKEFAERAARKNPGNEEAEVALADALRLAGNLVAARSELDRARATEATPEAETLRVAALLAIAEAQGDQSAGRAPAEQAVHRDPELIRTRVLLARILSASGDMEGARRQVDALRVIDPEHPLLPALLAVLAREEGHRKAEEERARAAEAARLAAAAADADADAAAESGGYRELVKRGEKLLERGAVAQAKEAFTKAVALQPKGAEAKTGLGYVALENGNPELAIRLFRGPAAEVHPDALIGLGDAYRRLGRLRDALKQYRAYQRRYPSGERASIARRQIDLLQEQIND